MSAEQIHLERSLDVKASIQRALDYLFQKDIKASFFEIGDTIKSIRCTLEGENINIPGGMGKGVGLQSRASSLFEAIEHLFWSWDNPVLQIQKLDLDNSDFFLDQGSPNFRKICGINEVFMSRVSFSSLVDDSDTISFPYFLTNPYYKPTDDREISVFKRFSIQRYGSNSGTASGVNKPDALLHGLLELIERDALGIELLSTVVKSPALPVRKIDHRCFTEHIQDLINIISIENGVNISIWDITSDLGIPAVLASVQGELDGVTNRYFGSGASLSFEYAAERAILESLQCFHAGKVGLLRRNILNEIDKIVLPYVKCLLDHGIFEYSGGEIKLSKLPDYGFAALGNLTSSQQLSIVLERLSTFGIKVYFRKIIDDGLIAVYQVVAPKLERFNLVASGVPVIPGVRGYSFLT